jgi:type VI secretion system protein ImpK
MRAAPAQLMEQVADAIDQFEREVRAAGLTPEQTRVAKYIICATADDIVQNIPSEDRHVWTQYSMLSRFFGERVGGVRFFEELDRAKQDPTVNYNLLELMYACLALGFQGIHRTSAGGAATLQQIQRNLYETLRRVKRPHNELSPRWQGQELATQAARAQVPVWAVGALVGVFLLAIYFILRSLLGGNAEAVASALISVHPTDEVGIQRRVFAPPPPPPPPPTQVVRLRGVLSPPLTVQEQGNVIVIRMANLALFDPGAATVRDEFKPLIAKIATLLEQEPGSIKVIGHTDGQPISNLRFPSNFHLSVERANAVAALLRTAITKPERIETEGKGADVPIAPNTTPQGRAQNRRVEILIPRTG